MAFEGSNLVGVDIGSSSVKVALVREARGRLEITRFGYEALPPHTVVDGSAMNRGAVVEALRRTLQQAKVTQRECAISVSGHMVIIKKLVVPMMTDAELSEHMNWEAQKQIPFDIKEMQIDYEVLRSRPDQDQMDILLVAAKREVIGEYASLATDARLKPVVVDIDAFCLQNLFERTVGLAPAGTIMLLDVGASLTTLNIVTDGVSAFARYIAHGGEAITEEIQKQLGVSRDVAEAYKCGGGGQEVVPREVEQVIRNVADGLAAEIQRSIDFYLATIGEGEIGRIYLSGGASRLRALAGAIERRSRVPVEIFDPLQSMTVDAKTVDVGKLQQFASLAGVAMGLSLRKSRERRG